MQPARPGAPAAAPSEDRPGPAVKPAAGKTADPRVCAGSTGLRFFTCCLLFTVDDDSKLVFHSGNKTISCRSQSCPTRNRRTSADLQAESSLGLDNQTMCMCVRGYTVYAFYYRFFDGIYVVRCFGIKEK